MAPRAPLPRLWEAGWQPSSHQQPPARRTPHEVGERRSSGPITDHALHQAENTPCITIAKPVSPPTKTPASVQWLTAAAGSVTADEHLASHLVSVGNQTRSAPDSSMETTSPGDMPPVASGRLRGAAPLMANGLSGSDGGAVTPPPGDGLPRRGVITPPGPRAYSRRRAGRRQLRGASSSVDSNAVRRRQKRGIGSVGAGSRFT